MKTLIINADDYNLTPGCSRAIDDALRAGAVTSSSCLVWGPYDKTAECQRADGGPLLQNPWHGVHLRLTDGWPVLPVEQVRSLVNAAGMFPTSQQAVSMKAINQEEVYHEWSEQISLFLKAGGVLTHIDSHRHTHALLNLHGVYQRLCSEFQVAGVPLSWRQREGLRAAGVPCVDFVETRWTDGALGTLLKLLGEDFEKHETVHLMCHPAYNDVELAKVSTMTEVRQLEFEVLMGSGLSNWLRGRMIKLGGYDNMKPAPDPLAKVDLLFLAWNRRRFTVEALAVLLNNTDWTRVRSVLLYDDGSTDKTLDTMYNFMALCPVTCSLRETNFRSPVAIMNDYLQREPAPWFVKIDNDTMVPPGWLPDCIEVLRQHPHVDLLGIEPKYPIPRFATTPRTCEPTDHIGGIGFMRTAAFEEGLPEAHGRMGFSDWQVHHDVNKAWLNPAIPVILLDRLPFEPWASLSAEYEAKGWQRPWQRYTDADRKLWEWWKK